MLALSIHQPVATLLARGWCRCHERAWATHHRGPVLIHASEHVSGADRALWRILERLAGIPGPGDLGWRDPLDAPRGCLVAETVLTDCIPVSALYGDRPVVFLRPADARVNPLNPDHHLLVFAGARPLPKPVYCKAGPGLFEPPGHAGKLLGELGNREVPTLRPVVRAVEIIHSEATA